MASGLTVKALMDRVHEINQLIRINGKPITPYRYDAGAYDTPAIYPAIGPADYNERDSNDDYQEGVRTVRLIVVVGSTKAGKLNETAQKQAELLADAVPDVYRHRRFLQNSTDEELDGVIGSGCQIRRDTGVLPRGDIYAMEFTLSVPYYSQKGADE